MTLAEIFRDPDAPYRLSLFTEEEKAAVEATLWDKDGKPQLVCFGTGKNRPAKPEEVVRQLWLHRLLYTYRYDPKHIRVEAEVPMGREKKSADIIVYDAAHPTSAYIIVEVKKPKLKDGKNQLKSYCNATGAPIGVWSNGDQYSYYHRRDPNYFNDLTEIPRVDQSLEEVLNEKFTLEDLVKRDKLTTEHKSLKDLILEMEDEVLAAAGVDVFEDVFKLIFTKLFDEFLSGPEEKRDTRGLEFRNTGTATALKERIQNLFDRAKRKWDGVFSTDDKVKLTPTHLQVCVASLENVKLFNSNLEVVDEAFEYLINQTQKGEKGQYFTPRYIIDMCVKMMNPRETETLVDTAAGSAGFTVHSIFKVWGDIIADEGLQISNLFTLEKKPQRCADYVTEKVFAIDFDEKTVRVARCLNLIAGDGQTNVLLLNNLEWFRWDETVKEQDWLDVYNDGWKRLRQLREKNNSNRAFGFDLLMANPPFAGDQKQQDLLSRYDLGHKSKKDGTLGGLETSVGRDLLFIERNLDYLRPGGRMAVVLPQGRFNNASDARLRRFIAERARILGVVGLHPHTFQPHTGTKTSVLLLQKWNDDPDAGPLCPRVEDYPIFFATQRKPAKDSSGEKLYLTRPIVRYFERAAGDSELVTYQRADFLAKYGSIEEATVYEVQSHRKVGG